VSTESWRLEDVDGVRLARCAALEGIPGVAHAFSTRIAHGRSDFDLGPAEGEGESVRRRRREFAQAAGFGAGRPALLRQVHGKRIVSTLESSSSVSEADGSFRRLVPGEIAPVPAVRTADCVGLLVVDRRIGLVAAVHAGWRGVAAGIAHEAMGALAALGSVPRDLVVAMGPAISACCYEVGEEVVAAIRAACPPRAFHPSRGRRGLVTVDLHAALRAQLIAAGVPEAAIHGAPWCTRCRNDLFFSVRAEGASAGRLMAAIGPAGAA
jgi:YfiH family protein